MTDEPLVLAVDDLPANVRLLDAVLSPRGYRVKDFNLTKAGTALFAGWTDEEKRANMRQARAIFRRFGFTRVPVWTKTLADML